MKTIEKNKNNNNREEVPVEKAEFMVGDVLWFDKRDKQKEDYDKVSTTDCAR